MANFTIADIKALRDQLGTGMVDTKKALEEADGDVEKAVEILRLKGAKGNAKRADRSTSEGLVAAREEAGKVTLIELACETDFVAKNERFIALADKVADAAAAVAADSVEAALAAPAGSQTVAQLIDDEAAIIGEKVELRRVRTLSGDHFEIYLHKTSKDLPPQVGVVVAYTDLATTVHEPGRAYQWGTLVHRAHRGHRLGVAVKVANLRLLQSERPDIVRLTTYNAEVNAHMIGVNEALGFRPVARLGDFQKRL